MLGVEAVKVGVLKKSEVEEAQRVMRLAFGTFLGMPDPEGFLKGRAFIAPRSRAANVKLFAAREEGRLIGINVLTRWGSCAFLGPLAVLPEYWDKGVGQQLMSAAVRTLDAWGVRHTGLFTFPHSTKHVGLYQKFGFWPEYLTALMSKVPEAGVEDSFRSLGKLKKTEREEAIRACGRLTNAISPGLDLGDEMRAVLKEGLGEVVLIYTGRTLDGFAVCMTGEGTEGGAKVCYVKFGASRGGRGAGVRFDALLGACEAFAASRDVNLEAGMNLAREGAFRRMRARGFRVVAQGVAMQRPHVAGFDRADAYVICDWR